MLLFIEGFEGFGDTLGAAPVGFDRKYNSVANTSGIDIETGRHSGFSAEMNGNSLHFQTFALTTNATIVVGMAMKYPSFVAARILALYDGVTEGINLRMKTDGEIEVYRANTLLGTTTGASVGLNAWSYLEVKVLSNDTTGTVEVRINGDTKLSLTGIDTKVGSNAYHDAVRFLGITAIGHSIDDVYILDGSGSANNNFLGDQRVVAIFPNAEGTTNDFTPSTGTDNSALVDEVAPNDDTDYVESSTVGHKDLYAYGNISGLGTIAGVQVNTDCRETDASDFNVITVVRSNVTESDDAGQALTASYLTKFRIVEQDPDTAAAWTEAGVNAAEFGVKVG